MVIGQRIKRGDWSANSPRIEAGADSQRLGVVARVLKLRTGRLSDKSLKLDGHPASCGKSIEYGWVKFAFEFMLCLSIKCVLKRGNTLRFSTGRMDAVAVAN